MGKTYTDIAKHYQRKGEDIPHWLAKKLKRDQHGLCAGFRWGNSRRSKAKDKQITTQIERSQLKRKRGMI
ncbi:hypothetical protein VPFG_00373 [Vibrio phage nt-1]|uniref:Uncharacterized protein n=1 Tax=Vibrio phage nt-1 TaxID=115992 RepID=R9TJ21_9CAUD|nr:hypothetical protein VPFG_00373 [Vibrio phage nt-1]AGN30370.1 hypothetical protein VPFG_00373 [Vibrio phage nt-1]